MGEDHLENPGEDRRLISFKKWNGDIA